MRDTRFAIDQVVVWDVVEQDLPELKLAIEALLTQLDTKP